MKNKTIEYNEIVCPATGEKFIPGRSNQIYISRDVQIKHNNNRTKLKRMELKNLNDRIISNQRKLKKMYDFMTKYNWEKIHIGYISFEEFDLKTYSKSSNNATTGGRICWSLDYGIEALDETMTYFYIHKIK